MTLSKTLQLGAAVCAAALGVAASASAATLVTTSITMDASYYNGGVPGAGASGDYISAYNTAAAAPATDGYFNQTLKSWNAWSNSSHAGGAHLDLAYHDQVDFTATQAGTYTFRFGVDFGWGGTLIVDGVAEQTNTNNMWWNDNYNDPTQYFTTTLTLAAGSSHVIDIYGAEDGDDGQSQGQWSFNGGNFSSFAVPEPASWALMLVGFGLGGAALRIRRWARAAV